MGNGDLDPSNYPGFHPVWGDYGHDSGGECGVPLVHRFTAPENGNSIFWYSFDVGFVHVIQMSSEHDWMPGSPQYEWIEHDLKTVDRAVTPWIVLTTHRPLYTTSNRILWDWFVARVFRHYFEDLLHQYQVNLVLVRSKSADINENISPTGGRLVTNTCTNGVAQFMTANVGQMVVFTSL